VLARFDTHIFGEALTSRPYWHGAPLALELTLVSLAAACVIGFFLALGRSSRFRSVRGFVFFYSWIFRATPTLLQLSGGQQQRVAIARALVMRPKAMLFDEPTSALDVELVREVLDVMEGLARDGMTMVVVSHELRFAHHVASSILMMDEGQVIEEAPPDRFFASPSHERTTSFLALVE